MAAVGEAGIFFPGRADAETGAIQVAFEFGHTAAAGVIAGEVESGTSAVGRVGWIAGNACVWRSGIDTPGICSRSCIDISQRVSCLHLEGVAAGGQAGIALWGWCRR